MIGDKKALLQELEKGIEQAYGDKAFGLGDDVIKLRAPLTMALITGPLDPFIDKESRAQKVPKAMIQSVLFQEMITADPGDWKVIEKIGMWGYRADTSTFGREWADRFSHPLSKSQYSTGVGQIFPTTAMEAENWLRRKLGQGTDLWDPNNLDHQKAMYEKLQDPATNIHYLALNLRREAGNKSKNVNFDEFAVGIRNGLADMNDQQKETTFAAYNGSGQRAKEYGAKVMRYYRAFEDYNPTPRIIEDDIYRNMAKGQDSSSIHLASTIRPLMRVQEIGGGFEPIKREDYSNVLMAAIGVKAFVEGAQALGHPLPSGLAKLEKRTLDNMVEGRTSWSDEWYGQLKRANFPGGVVSREKAEDIYREHLYAKGVLQRPEEKNQEGPQNFEQEMANSAARTRSVSRGPDIA